MAAVGWLIECALLRRVFGQSQVAVAILTIAIGFVLRFVAGAIWGHEPRMLESPIRRGDHHAGRLRSGSTRSSSSS